MPPTGPARNRTWMVHPGGARTRGNRSQPQATGYWFHAQAGGSRVIERGGPTVQLPPRARLQALRSLIPGLFRFRPSPLGGDGAALAMCTAPAARAACRPLPFVQLGDHRDSTTPPRPMPSSLRLIGRSAADAAPRKRPGGTGDRHRGAPRDGAGPDPAGAVVRRCCGVAVATRAVG